MSNRSFWLLIGAMRSGKSFLANRLAERYCNGGGNALFYNLGKPSDFECASPIIGKTVAEHLRGLTKEQRQDFRIEGELYRYTDKKHKERDFRLFPYEWAGAAAKMARLEPASERMLFDTVFNYFANTLIVLDDCRAMFRNGLSAEAITLFSRVNHTGIKSPWQGYRGAGCDVMAITHSPDEACVDDMMNYATAVCLFRTEKEPDYKAIKNLYIRENYQKNFHKLAKSPKYSFLYLEPASDKAIIVTP